MQDDKPGSRTTPILMRWLVESDDWFNAHPYQGALVLIIAGTLLGWMWAAVEITRGVHV